VLRVETPDGLRLAVHAHGGDGPPVLLCHATGFHGAVWDPVAAELGGDLDRWAVDFRGHGASVVPEGSPLQDWAAFGVDVLAVVDGLGLPPGGVLGVGHSMGGAALLLAEQARPGTFRGIWAFEPITPPRAAMPGGPNPLSEGARRRRPVFASAADALANFAAKPPFDRLRADALHAYVRHGFVPDPEAGPQAVRLACRPEDEARVYEGGGSHGAFERLGEVGCPVVVAHGEDPVGPASFAPLVADALPHGRLEPIAHVGHFGPLESPTAIAAAIRAFATDLG
jgi:pimeloyl-ACP methyl ester carboxylesterase